MMNNYIFSLFILYAIVNIAFTVPVDQISSENVGNQIEQNALENRQLFQGDILGYELKGDRFASAYRFHIWPGGVIPYSIDYRLIRQSDLIKRAMRAIESKTCIKFVPRTFERDYVSIQYSGGCASYVGRIRGAQPVSLGSGCFNLGTVIHELTHAVGFHHQHSRTDRDNYLNIHWGNIRYTERDQFSKLSQHEGINYKPFDFESIMLYGKYYFSANGFPTITPKDPRNHLRNVWDKFNLSDDDVYSINQLYKCNNK